VREVSDYTGLAVGTIYNMVSQRRIPFTKLGGTVRFDRYKLDKWAEANSQKVRTPLAA
jgi:excisionase family DNA binding protein